MCGCTQSYMKAYVLEAGETSLCSAVTKAGCSDQESAFIVKMQGSDVESNRQQLVRLQGMAAKPMKEDLKQWFLFFFSTHGRCRRTVTYVRVGCSNALPS